MNECPLFCLPVFRLTCQTGSLAIFTSLLFERPGFAALLLLVRGKTRLFSLFPLLDYFLSTAFLSLFAARLYFASR